MDFRDYPGFNEEETAYAEEQYANAVLWGHNTEKTITAELEGVVSRIDDFTKHLKTIVENRDFNSTEYMRGAICMNDVGPGGWIPSFVLNNREDLTMPENQVMMYGDDVTSYAACRKYIKDLIELDTACARMNTILSEFALEGIYGRLSWVMSFKKAGYDTALYGQIDTDIELFSWQLARKLNEIPDTRATAWYRNYQDRLFSGGTGLSADEIKRQYRAERLKDFQADWKKRGVGPCLAERSDGSYSVQAEWDSKMDVLDRYADILTRQEPHESNMKEFVEKVDKVLTEVLIPNEQRLTLKGCIAVNASFKRCAQQVKNMVQQAIDEYNMFFDSSEAPFCFMQNPGALENAVPNYGWNPCKDYPWAHGTSYHSLYRMAAEALTKQCKDYVTKAGESHLRDN